MRRCKVLKGKVSQRSEGLMGCKIELHEACIKGVEDGMIG